VTVKLTFEILESRSPKHWIGFWARGETPNILDGNMVYFSGTSANYVVEYSHLSVEVRGGGTGQTNDSGRN